LELIIQNHARLVGSSGFQVVLLMALQLTITNRMLQRNSSHFVKWRLTIWSIDVKAIRSTDLVVYGRVILIYVYTDDIVCHRVVLSNVMTF